MTGIYGARGLLLAAAAVCVLAAGGCAARSPIHETGVTEETVRQTAGESGSDTTEEMTVSESSKEFSFSGKTEAEEREKNADGKAAEAALNEAESESAEESMDRLESVLKGMAWTALSKRMVYNTADSSFAWWCLYGIAGTLAEPGEAEVTIKTEELEQSISVLFEGKNQLPDIPEDMADFIVSGEKNESVLFRLSGDVTGTFLFSEPEHIDETHVKITAAWESGEEDLPAIHFYLVDRTGDGYPYTVQYMEMDGYVCNDILEGDRVFEP